MGLTGCVSEIYFVRQTGSVCKTINMVLKISLCYQYSFMASFYNLSTLRTLGILNSMASRHGKNNPREKLAELTLLNKDCKILQKQNNTTEKIYCSKQITLSIKVLLKQNLL